MRASQRLLERVSARPTLTAGIVLAVLAAAIWGPAVRDVGFYYDDWWLLAAMDEASSRSPVDVFEACRTVEPAGRPGGCVYHAAAFLVTGQHAKAYHLLSVGFVWLCALLLYVLLTRCRLHWGLALGVAALWVIFPGSDATRLWSAAFTAQPVLALYIAAVLLGIAGVRRGGRGGIAMHAGAVTIFLALMLTYEFIIPLVAIAGVFYWLATPGRRAVRHGLVDLGVAVAFLI
jgi:hypothetical protein